MRRGLRIVICSNWDWDLREAVAESGLTAAVDAMVSSAWVGARKPHPRIFAAALAEAGVAPERAVFVGDTWGPDVVGPSEAGMTPLYLRRDGHWPDGTAPPDPGDRRGRARPPRRHRPARLSPRGAAGPRRSLAP